MDPFAADLHAFVALMPLRRFDGRNRGDVAAALFWHPAL
jgi:hypothetical protein